jgi:hypothetical protein
VRWRDHPFVRVPLETAVGASSRLGVVFGVLTLAAGLPSGRAPLSR